GAFAGLVGSITVGVYAGFLASALAGAAVAALFALFAVVLRRDQIITGTAVTLFGLGLTGTLYRRAFGATGAALRANTQHATGLPGLDRIPVIGPALFQQPAITYLAYIMVPVLWWAMYRTRCGLALRAVGENPQAARAAGIDPRRVQLGAVMFGGIMGGIAGGT